MGKQVDRDVRLGDTIIDNDPKHHGHRWGIVIALAPHAVRPSHSKMRVEWTTGFRTWCLISRIGGSQKGYTLVKENDGRRS